MQIQVIASPENTYVVNELYRLIGKETGRSAVSAGAYGTHGLITILSVRAEGGQREILVVDCDRDQIQAVLEWCSEMEESIEFDDLVIHLVRKA
jgi:hypothetical protein